MQRWVLRIRLIARVNGHPAAYQLRKSDHQTPQSLEWALYRQKCHSPGEMVLAPCSNLGLLSRGAIIMQNSQGCKSSKLGFWTLASPESRLALAGGARPSLQWSEACAGDGGHHAAQRCAHHVERR